MKMTVQLFYVPPALFIYLLTYYKIVYTYSTEKRLKKLN